MQIYKDNEFNSRICSTAYIPITHPIVATIFAKRQLQLRSDVYKDEVERFYTQTTELNGHTLNKLNTKIKLICAIKLMLIATMIFSGLLYNILLACFVLAVLPNVAILEDEIKVQINTLRFFEDTLFSLPDKDILIEELIRK